MVKEDSGYSDSGSTAGVLTVLTNTSFSSSPSSSSLSSTSPSHSSACLFSPSYIRSPSSPSSSVSSASCLLLSPARHQHQQSQLAAAHAAAVAAASSTGHSSHSQQSASSNGGQSGFKERTKRSRTSFKNHQLRKMKEYFRTNQNPDSNELKKLSIETGLLKRVLQVWFQNARAKWRRSMFKQSSLGPQVVEECKPLVELTSGTSSTSATAAAGGGGQTTIVNSNGDINNCHNSTLNMNPFLSPVESPDTESTLTPIDGSNFTHATDHTLYHPCNNNSGTSSYNYNGSIVNNTSDLSQVNDSSCHYSIPLHHAPASHNLNPPTASPTCSPATAVTASSSSSASSSYSRPSLMAHVTF